MSSTIIAILIMAGSCGGLLLTIFLRHRLPPHHEEEATRDLLKIATGMLATLVALILGLLVSSAKSTFDTATAEITQSGAQIITLNRTLASYGPEAQPVRALLQRSLAASIERIWPGRQAHAAPQSSASTPRRPTNLPMPSAGWRRRMTYRSVCRRRPKRNWPAWPRRAG